MTSILHARRLPQDYRTCQSAVGSEQRHFRQDDAERLFAIERQRRLGPIR
jgi:hypothetical protein